MLKTIVAAALSITAGTADAEAIWQNLDVGMTKVQVKALYPDGMIALTPDCVFNIIPKFSSGRLSAVWLKMGDHMYTAPALAAHEVACKETIKATIISKYGDPVDTSSVPMAYNIDQMVTYTSRNGNILINYVAALRGNFQNITYTFNPTKMPAHADAGAASKL